ncbi:type IX secretion system membrane protein PorP/SprF [Arcicella sp. LKC2W]|uniref:PorP/SprF family type IX secretion system membrane protein n=1 Tax=Arcicella sp. LKC2W TaxID=2984198 RepID=UPI002B1FA9EA|nr:type IX secretion system membrane protein PorP/SprF [Arcicella sp. LKC2W]MEA5461220.1 type IX secretion system membrane protein PorP/SprF [Arcicella sp. LKC2W]
MQKIVLIIFLTSFSLIGFAQSKPQYSQYMMNSYLINPAISGIEDYVDIKTGYRNQWTDFPGAPSTYYVSANIPIGKPDRTSTGATPNISKTIRRPLSLSTEFRGAARVPGHHGIGIAIVSDHIGANTQNSITASYAYHIPVSGNVKLSIGASGGITQYSVDFSKIQVRDNPDQAILDNGSLSAIQPYINLGAWLYSRHFFLGLSANQLIFDNFNYQNSNQTVSTYSWIGTAYPHYFLTAGYRAEINEDWAVIPSTLIKRVNQAPMSFDINLKAVHKDRFWFGGSYRHKDAVVGLLGVNISSFINLGYSYDYTLSDIRERSKGSHEVVLGIMLNNRHRIVCPQNLW